MATQFPATVGQRLLWLLDRYRNATGALNCPVVCRVDGRLDLARLQAALSEVTARHESLRTTLAGRGPALTQHIHPPRPVVPDLIDLSHRPDPPAAARLALAAELASRIDPGDWPLRPTVWRISPREHLLCVNVHHLVTDAWSCSVIFRDLWRCYAGTDPEPVACQYRDFAEWQRRRVDSGELRRHLAYWTSQLAGARMPDLPSATGRPAPVTTAAEIRPEVVDRLRGLARRLRTTLFTVLLALFYRQLHELTGRTDLTVSSVYANRSRPEHQRVVGFLANLVMLRTSVPPGGDIGELVRRSHATVLDAFVHQELPYHMLPLGTGEDVPTRRPDQLVFQMLAEPAERLPIGDLEVEAFVPDGVASRFHTEFAVVPRRAGLTLLLFSTDLDPAVADRLVRGYAERAAAVVAAAGTA